MTIKSNNLAEDINLLAMQRKLLEELISYAQQLARASKGLEAVSQILKPSQIPSIKEKSFIRELTAHLKELNDDELRKSLELLDQHVTNELQLILELAGMRKEQFVRNLKNKSDEDIKLLYDKLQLELKEFRRKAQTDVAVRLELYDRGVQISAANLGIDQEQIFKQLEVVKMQEVKNKQAVKSEMKTYISEIDTILNNAKYPDAIKQKFLDAKVDVARALDDLNNGKDIEEIPCYVEPVDMGEGFFFGMQYEDIEEDESETEEPDNEQCEIKDNVDESNIEIFYDQIVLFFQTLRFWLVTPMSVSWEEAKKRVRKK